MQDEGNSSIPLQLGRNGPGHLRETNGEMPSLTGLISEEPDNRHQKNVLHSMLLTAILSKAMYA